MDSISIQEHGQDTQEKVRVGLIQEPELISSIISTRGRRLMNEPKVVILVVDKKLRRIFVPAGTEVMVVFGRKQWKRAVKGLKTEGHKLIGGPS